MFSRSALEPQHILTGAQAQTNVGAMKENKRHMRRTKSDGYRSSAGKMRAENEKRRLVDRIIRWKIFQLAKANKNQACYFHTYNMATPSQWQYQASVPSSILHKV